MPQESKKGKKEKIQNKIKFEQSVSEMLCLTRYLSVIIGDLVPESNRSWKLYLILREIVGVVTVPRFTTPDIYRVRYLIRKQNELYLELFGSLKPKLHFSVHLPNVMKNNGPPIHFWSMSGERKNKMLKDIAANTTSNRSLSLTIAIKNHLYQCYMRHCCKNVKGYISVGTIDSETDSEVNKFIPDVNETRTYKFINIYGAKHSQGTIIVTSVDDKGPHFGRIEKIFEIANELYVSVTQVDIISFSYHYQAYQIFICNKQALYQCKYLPKTISTVNFN